MFMMAPSARILSVVALIGTWCSAHANEFLGQRQEVTKEFVEQTLGELAATKDGARLVAIQRELQPMYASLPKNEQGQLDSSTVRYALHRYFVQKHGWYVQGLSPAGSSLTTSSAAIVTEMAPAYIQGLLEKQLSHAGMQLQDLAVFAATMSDLVYSEGIKNLHAVYEILGVPTTGDVSLADFNSAVRGYLSVTIVGEFGPKLVDASGLKPVEALAKEFYPEYNDLLLWLRDTRLTRDFVQLSRQNPFQVRQGISPEQADALMHDLYHKFGSLNNLECIAVKDKLVEAEYPGTGRVSLARFYAQTENPILESVAYLRNMGVLDESNPGSLALMIPNYMSSPSRCMPFSSYFSVCCPDDCESVLGRIEEAVAEPSADPELIVDIVSGTPSDTQEAPRNISATLVRRLDEIAGRHQGRVPLHGRLFMQWLHHAYPRECPFPHVSGTVNPVTQDEWLVMHPEIDNVDATIAEREQHANSHVHDLESLEPLPWTDVEELFATHKTEAESRIGSYLRLAMMVIVVLSFTLPLVRGSAALVGSKRGDEKRVVMV